MSLDSPVPLPTNLIFIEWITGVKRSFNQVINPKLRLEGEAGRQASSPRRKRMRRLQSREQMRIHSHKEVKSSVVGSATHMVN